MAAKNTQARIGLLGELPPTTIAALNTSADLTTRLERLNHDTLEPQLANGSLDLIVTSPAMVPGVLKQVRALDLDIPLIAATSRLRDREAEALMRLGVSDYVSSEETGRLLFCVQRELAASSGRAQLRNAKRRLKEIELRYSLACQGANDGVWDWDLLSNTIYYSPRWKQLIGFEPHEIENELSAWWDRIHPEDRTTFEADVRRHLDGEIPQLSVEYRIRNRFGAVRWMLTRGAAQRNKQGKAVRLAGSQTDITARKLAEGRLAHAAAHDSLTGLPNRALFLDRLRHAIRRYQRSQVDRFAVLFVDIDRFRLVVDSLGHVAGDELLMKTAGRISCCLRPGDTVARFGGNVFTLLLEDIDGFAEATGVAIRIQAEVALPLRIKGVDVYPTASIGMKLSSSSSQNAGDILKDADTALSKAKAQGGGHHAVFDAQMSVEASQRLRLETELRQAIDRNEFVATYQPIVDIKSRAIVSAEVLVRWQHPARGLLSPDAFLPVAEETGLIIPIDWRVFEIGVAQLRAWQDEFEGLDLRLAINLSARHFGRAHLAERLSSICETHEISPHSLKLEITETAILDTSGSTPLQLLQLRDLGFELCLDDFGTGYSPLGNLYQLPIDTLKIDRSFVSRMVGDKKNTEIVRSLVNLARNLDKHVIAEGVETESQLASLTQMNCEMGQGWLFARALPAADFARLLGAPSL